MCFACQVYEINQNSGPPLESEPLQSERFSQLSMIDVLGPVSEK